MPTQTLDLTEEYAAFIRQSIDDGRYRDASEVIGAGLKLLQRQDSEKLDELRRLGDEGFDQIDRGECEIVDPRDLGQFISKLGGDSRSADRQ